VDSFASLRLNKFIEAQQLLFTHKQTNNNNNKNKMGHVKFGKGEAINNKRPREEAQQVSAEEVSAKKQKIEQLQTQFTRFDELNIDESLKAALKHDFGFENMTEIQARSIPVALDRTDTDIIGQARTGSGKTLAFLIPCIQYLITEKFSKDDGLGALVLAPTRELAIQISTVAEKLISSQYMKSHKLRYSVIMGGSNKSNEAKELQQGVNLIVATPGRLLDHLNSTDNFRVDKLKYFVLDEADMLIDVGFEESIKRISAKLPKNRLTFLFSATFTDKVEDLAALSMKKMPLKIGFSDAKNVNTLKQMYIECKADRKYATLINMLKANKDKKVIVFVSIKLSVEYVSYLLDGFEMNNIALHGNMSQDARTQTFMKFMEQKEPGVMVATDVAARGLDFPNVDLIVQVDIPEQIANYFHRVGRTARAGKSGTALLMLTPIEVEVCLPVFNNYFRGEATEEQDIADKTLQPYNCSISEDGVEKDHAKIMEWVRSDNYMYSAAPKIASTLANVFRMYFRKYGFKHNQFDENALKASLGMNVGRGGGSGGGGRGGKKY
jgi:ATP-dependent RNA helicase DDX18/HAS1